jgi:hypothetical protein
MRRLILSCLAATAAVLTLSGCGSMDSNYTVHRLPSGLEVKVLGVTKMFFAKGDPALMLKHRTDLRIEDQARLRKEVEEVWQAFRVDVERAGVKAAIISAHEPPRRLLILSTNKSYNFLIQKSEAGVWEFLDDHKQSG